MTSVQSRIPRVRRGGRRPGWTLLTALLVLAIAASSVLVFTSRVELLKLAVIVSLWAAAVAAFASVIYRRQSDADQARAHHLKLVYDLQLEREISARREYELMVESQLRRELAAELRDQAADEVAALRAELSALRANLEILFEADLGTRPALETEHTTVRAYSDWARDGDGVRVGHEAAAVYRDDSAAQAGENPIIDVPEVGVPTGGEPSPAPPQPVAEPPEYHGSHRRTPDDGGWPPGGRTPPEHAPPYRGRESRLEPEPPRRTASWSRPWAPEPASWQPVDTHGQWSPPGAAGTDWVPHTDADPARAAAEDRSVDGSAPSDPPRSRHSRHAAPDEPVVDFATETEGPRLYREGRGRADAPRPGRAPGAHAFTAQPDAAESSAARHRSADPADGQTGPATGGESVAELLARLQAGSAGGGRRHRRQD